MAPSTHFWLRFAAVFLILVLHLMPRGWLPRAPWAETPADPAPVASR
jgi:hypothetical protein